MVFRAKTDKGHRSRTTGAAIAEATKELEKGITIYMPESIHRRFKTRTAANGEKMNAVLLRAIADYIEK